MTGLGRQRIVTFGVVLLVMVPVALGLWLWPEGLVTYVIASVVLFLGLVAGVAFGEARAREQIRYYRRRIRALERRVGDRS